ncbi:cytochrome c oxidase subunit 7A2-like, mitochondrial [Glandiceps talaboti]
MSYKYNSFGGKLSKTSTNVAYHPEGLKGKVEERPPIRWAQKPVPYSPTTNPMGGDGMLGVRNQVYNKQRVFQRSSLPVHLKGGRFDKILYVATLAGCVFGTGWTFYELFKASMPRKNE